LTSESPVLALFCRAKPRRAWFDEIKTEGGRLAYYSTATKRSNKLGSKERLANLIWARDHCDGLVRLVVTFPKKVTDQKRSIGCCFPSDGLLMRIAHLDERTGAFRLESVTEYSLNQLSAEGCPGWGNALRAAEASAAGRRQQS
jgi:hypothetical protein